MYIMGTLLRHGSEEQKQRYLPKIASGGAAPAGLRRHRARRRLGDHQDQTAPYAGRDDWRINGQKIFISRALTPT